MEEAGVGQRDVFHDAAKTALIKDGWNITHDPLLLAFGATNVYVDLGAELPMAAEREGRRIAIEVKSFLGPSGVTELERAIGQYTLYRSLLRRQEPDRTLYLAVPRRAFDAFVGQPSTMRVLTDEHIRLVVFDPHVEEVISWHE
ncbi:MAG: element excision factor XisH family protein [Candidatus Xenobia bacterium]